MSREPSKYSRYVSSHTHSADSLSFSHFRILLGILLLRLFSFFLYFLLLLFQNPQHNSPGHVDVELIERALKIYSSDRLSEPQIKELLKQFRLFAKGGKFVNYIEFVQMLTGE